MGDATGPGGTHGEAEGNQPLQRAPRGCGTLLVIVVALIVGAGLYLIAVRHEALFVDLAALSGMLFCF